MTNANDPDKLPAKFVQAAQPAADYAAARQAALDVLNERQWQEHDEVHDGSGRSEEFPSDLRARHAEEWHQFERKWPELAPTAPAAAAGPKPPGL